MKGTLRSFQVMQIFISLLPFVIFVSFVVHKLRDEMRQSRLHSLCAERHAQRAAELASAGVGPLIHPSSTRSFNLRFDCG